MAGIPIAQFLDWAANTGPQFLTGENHIVNAVSRRSYLLGKFLRNKPASRILQGSDTIQETLYLDAQRTFQEFARGDRPRIPAAPDPVADDHHDAHRDRRQERHRDAAQVGLRTHDVQCQHDAAERDRQGYRDA